MDTEIMRKGPKLLSNPARRLAIIAYANGGLERLQGLANASPTELACIYQGAALALLLFMDPTYRGVSPLAVAKAWGVI